MQHNQLSDTICAIATPPGIGAIAVIRLSGKDAITIANKIFYGTDLLQQPSHTIHFGTIRNNNKIIDEVLVSIFKDKKSYTGENTVEISTHGSPYIQQQVLQLVLKNGAKQAGPGEFTFRAFMNGKMDLSQAEAVADVIASTSEAAHQLAIHQMRGGFSIEISKLREELIHFASLIELELDFSEEDVEFANRNDLKALVMNLQNKIHRLIASFNYGNVIKTGVPVAIIGEPNVGKSTLLNALLNEERAIVSAIAGTTRDTIEDEISIKGINFRFVDTAGIRETKDEIESIGIKKSYEKIDQASVVLLLVDASTISQNQLQLQLTTIENRIQDKNKLVLIIANKVDIGNEQEIKQKFKSFNNIVFISAKENKNMEEITEKLFDYVNSGLIKANDAVVTNARHFESLTQANAALINVLEGLDNNVTGDFLAMDIRQALYHLGLISGIISNEDLLDTIFSKFCIGK
ncbi:MAG: tRNA uridine-5-carboxymethylaminomethyl(34) synthesis GTPase MnmE [Vicingaceae bacterium]|nr:tRNA uridine-5-carboxymethylaminomethyl(34) synthesis GTPase MnmE [Vicingaceae bacterium]